jgi:molybdopterin-guanine dinucleotide biosynthesis protein A
MVIIRFVLFIQKNCIEPIEHLVGLGELKVTNLFSYVKVKKVKFPESNPDCDLKVFFNINTYEDYIKAVSLLKDAVL